MEQRTEQPFWASVAEFPLFVVRMYLNPRNVVRNADWDNREQWWRASLYMIFVGAIVVWAFHDNRVLADVDKPLLSTFKGVVMRAHLRSWDWLGPVYSGFKLSQGEAMRLWDTLLTSGFLLYTVFAGLIGVEAVARLRMWRFGGGWRNAMGTALYGYMAMLPLLSLSLVPLGQLLICRHCGVRLALFILLNIAGWAYLGYFTLGDLGERPANGVVHLLKSIGYGLVQFVLAYVVFLVLIACVIPL